MKRRHSSSSKSCAIPSSNANIHIINQHILKVKQIPEMEENLLCVPSGAYLHKSLNRMVVKMKWKASNRIIILNYKFKQKPE